MTGIRFSRVRLSGYLTTLFLSELRVRHRYKHSRHSASWLFFTIGEAVRTILQQGSDLTELRQILKEIENFTFDDLWGFAENFWVLLDIPFCWTLSEKLPDFWQKLPLYGLQTIYATMFIWPVLDQMAEERTFSSNRVFGLAAPKKVSGSRRTRTASIWTAAAWFCL